MGLLNKENYTLKGTLPASAVKIRIWKENEDGKAVADGGNRLDGVAAQQVQATVQKGVRPVYEIGSPNYYLVDGRPQGTGQIAYIFGPSGAIVSRIKDFADICSPCTLEVLCDGEKACKKGEAGAKKEGVHFKSGTLTSFAIQATSQDFMVTGNIGFIFMDIMDCDTTKNWT